MERNTEIEIGDYIEPTALLTTCKIVIRWAWRLLGLKIGRITIPEARALSSSDKLPTCFRGMPEEPYSDTLSRASFFVLPYPESVAHPGRAPLSSTAADRNLKQSGIFPGAMANFMKDACSRDGSV